MQAKVCGVCAASRGSVALVEGPWPKRSIGWRKAALGPTLAALSRAGRALLVKLQQKIATRPAAVAT